MNREDQPPRGAGLGGHTDPDQADLDRTSASAGVRPQREPAPPSPSVRTDCGFFPKEIQRGFSGDAEAWHRAMDGLLAGPSDGAPSLFLLGMVDSTNLRLRALAEEGAPPFTVVVADAQWAGRGRGGRVWDSPAGAGLWISVLLPPPPEGLPGVTPLAVGVAAAEAVEALGRGDPQAGCGGGTAALQSHLQVGLKWPNDLLLPLAGPRLGWGKVGGILCEVAPGGSGILAGVGINLFPVSRDALEPASRIPPLPRAFVLGEGEESVSSRGPVAEEYEPDAGGGLHSLCEQQVGGGPHNRCEQKARASLQTHAKIGLPAQVDQVRQTLAVQLMAALRRWADPPPSRMTPALQDAWAARDVLRGRVVELHDEAPLPGSPGRAAGAAGARLSRWRAAGVSREGALRLRPLEGGDERLLMAGRVRLEEPGG